MVGGATLLVLPTEKSMEVIVPRWEWRTFGASFGDADRRFRQLPPGNVQESDELYLLSPNCDANVKTRDQLMDIKALEQVNPDGLEQWRPVVKGKFPLPQPRLRGCAPPFAWHRCRRARTTPLSRSKQSWRTRRAACARSPCTRGGSGTPWENALRR